MVIEVLLLLFISSHMFKNPEILKSMSSHGGGGTWRWYLR